MTSPKVLITDTLPLVYFFADGGSKLSRNARAAFEGILVNKNVILVPAPVIWELSVLVENNHLSFDKPFLNWVDGLFAYSTINPLEFDHETVKILHGVRYHDDLFDRAIVATAIKAGFPLISNDKRMHKAKPCELFWD